MLFFAFLICALSVKFEIDVQKKKNSQLPGVKFNAPMTTVDYMVGQIFPWVEKQVKNVQIPDISEELHAPVVGKVNFDITNAVISNIGMSKPTVTISGQNQLSVSVSQLYVQGSADWKYKEKDWPHASDHGSFDLENLLVSITMDVVANIDSSEKSNIKISCTNFNLQWVQFDVKIHGGASWLYNWLIKNFKGSLEKSISKVLEETIPPVVTNLLQPLANSIVYKMPIGLDDIYFSYQVEEINFSPSGGFLSFGTDGFLEMSDGTHISGQPAAMPDSYGTQMIQGFFSQWSFDSTMFVAQKKGLLHYVVGAETGGLPMKLNTAAFEMFVPKLFQEYPNKPMQITLDADPQNIPHFIFNSTGYTMVGDILAKFQVLNTTTQIVEVFTLDCLTALKADVAITNGSEPYSYKVTVQLSLDYFEAKLMDSKVGSFDPSVLSQLMTAMITNFVLPNLNKYYLKGVDIPSTTELRPKNPKLTLFNGYFAATMDFDFYPPSSSSYSFLY